MQDVLHMPELRQKCHGLLNETWKAKVAAETTARIELSQSAGFVGQGRHMAEGPKAWQYNKSKKSRGGRQQYEYDDDGYDS